MNWNYMQPVTIRFGNGRIKGLAEEVKALGGNRGILITSPSFVKRGLAAKVQKESEGLICVIYGGVSPNPDIKECEACISMINDHEYDFVVALGGGSVLDCAKAAAVMCQEERPVKAYMEDASLLPDTSLPLIAVPTTAGTGSEITCVSVLSDHEAGVKKPLSCDAFYPTLAIVDPELTYSVPPHTTACTGMDVLCHALEAYWSKHHFPIGDALAVHALKLVFDYLQLACEQPEHALAREKMAEASVIAGLAFTIPKTTSAHACSYPLTNLLGIAHGEACGLTIDHFLRINGAEDDGRLLELAKMLGFKDVEAFADGITALKQSIGVRMDLKDLHLTGEQSEALIQGSKHPNLLNNPVEITETMLRDLYHKLV